MSSYKAKFLWHEVWVSAPLVGVCEYMGEKMIFSRNNDGKYDIRRFVEGGYEKAFQHHLEYRSNYGGIRDHDPKYYSMVYRKTPQDVVAVTKCFDYYNNSVHDIVDTISQDEIEWFYPPRAVKVSVNEREPFVPGEGTDLEYNEEKISMKSKD